MEPRLLNKNARTYRVFYWKPRRMAKAKKDGFMISNYNSTFAVVSIFSDLLTFCIFQYATSVFYQFHYIQWSKRGTTMIENNCSIEKVYSKNNLTAWLTIKTKKCNIEAWCIGISWAILGLWVILWSCNRQLSSFCYCSVITSWCHHWKLF